MTFISTKMINVSVSVVDVILDLEVQRFASLRMRPHSYDKLYRSSVQYTTVYYSMRRERRVWYWLRLMKISWPGSSAVTFAKLAVTVGAVKASSVVSVVALSTKVPETMQRVRYLKTGWQLLKSSYEGAAKQANTQSSASRCYSHVSQRFVQLY